MSTNLILLLGHSMSMQFTRKQMQISRMLAGDLKNRRFAQIHRAKVFPGTSDRQSSRVIDQSIPQGAAPMFSVRNKIASISIAIPIALFSAVSQASPITYAFDMPAFDGALDYAGKTSILNVTVDNGSMGSESQAYLNTEIIGLTVNFEGSVFGGAPTIYDGSATYITTDAIGTPLLNLAQNLDSSVVWSIPQFSIQIGTRDNGGPATYVVRNPAFFPQGFVIQGFTVTGHPRAAAVSEPSVLLLLGLGFAVAGLARRRQANGRSV